MKKTGLLLVILILILPLFSLAETSTLPFEDVLAILDAGGEFDFIDTRSTEAFDNAHIPFAHHITTLEEATVFPSLNADLNASIFIYGDNADLNQSMQNQFLQMGYQNTFLIGSLDDWRDITYSTEEEQKRLRIMGIFETSDLDGNPITESVFEGYPVNMINIWATYCNPCLDEMPDLAKLDSDLKEKGFRVIGLVTDITDNSLSPLADQVTFAKQIISHTEANYLHLFPSLDMYYSFLSQVTAVPCTFFVDEKGELISSVYYGSRDYTGWLEIITPLLEAKGQ